MEQRPELRYALHVSPIAATVAAERMRCMRLYRGAPWGALLYTGEVMYLLGTGPVPPRSGSKRVYYIRYSTIKTAIKRTTNLACTIVSINLNWKS
jgi:hypothetical protein